MRGGLSLEAMGVLLVGLSIACTPAETRGPEVVLPPAAGLGAPPPAQMGASESLAGTYRWEDGRIVLEVREGKLMGSNGTTSLVCSGAVDLACTWEEHGVEGWAHLRRDADGNLRGDFGKTGAHAPDGTWVLRRVIVHEGFAGDYTSTYGDVKLLQVGNRVTGTYPDGTLDCVVHDREIACDWIESGSSGKAKLVRSADGTLKGTWGNASSDTDGGDWEMEPE